MKEKDPLRLLEAAYAFDGSEEAWLAGLVDALMPYDLGEGIAVYVSELGEVPRVRAAANATKKSMESMHAVARLTPPALYNSLHAPMGLTDSMQAFPSALIAVGLLAPEVAKNPGELFSAVARLIPSEFEPPRAAFALAGGDANVATALAVFHCAPGDTFAPADAHVLDCFAAHLGSAFRLREVVGSAPTADHAEVEAVVAPDGKILDKRGPARDEDDAPLLDAIRNSEHARLRSASADERLDLMTALVEGRWSIVESTERDGRRVLLACRNSPRTARYRSLSTRERSVVSYAALGHSYKYIAYELGVAIATVASDLQMALRKLGIASRAELMPLFATQRLPVDD